MSALGDWAASIGEVGPEYLPDEVGFIGDEELLAMDRAVKVMTQDVNTQAPNSPAVRQFQLLRWTPYVMRWNVFFLDTQNTFSRVLNESDFIALRSEYETLGLEFKGMGGQTDAASAQEIQHAGSFLPSSTTLWTLGAIAGVSYWLFALGGLAVLSGRKGHAR